MKKWIVLIAGILSGILLYGCGTSSTDINETTVIINKNGEITDAIVESFDAEYYDASELQSMIDEELAEYGKLSGSKNHAQLAEFTVSKGAAKVLIEFATPADYASFNGVSFFYGTISEAYEDGYDLDVTLKSNTGQDTIGKAELMEMGKNHIVIVSEPIRIQTYGKILFSTANVDMIDEKSARISSESEGLAYIILK
ncbi:MAG: hypothetical protein QM697_07495 [Lachnospiraceae bacterium]